MTDLELTPASDDESIAWQGRPRKRIVHWGLVAGGVTAAVVLAVGAFLWQSGGIGVTFGVALLLVALAGFALPAGAAYLWREHTRYLLTDAALYHRTGVVRVTVTELGLDKVQNTAYAQGVFGTMFDHGTVTVDTAGSDGAELRLVALDDPDEVHRLVAARAGETAREDSIPGTVDQWRAVRAEITRVRRALDVD